jgi:hypothetical protein
MTMADRELERQRAIAIADARRRAAQAELERRQAAAASLPPPGSGAGDPVEAARLRTEAIEGAPPPRNQGARLASSVLYGAREMGIGAAGTLGATANLAANVPGLGFMRNDFGFEGMRERAEFLQSKVLPGLAGFEPEGRAEGAARVLGEFTPGGIVAGVARGLTRAGATIPGSIGRVAHEELFPLAATIAAQQATFGSALQPFAEAGAGLIAGTPASLGRALETTVEQGIRQRLNIDNLSAQERDQLFSNARRVAQIADDIGFPITPDEALQNENLRRLAVGLMQTEQGAELRASRMARVDVPGRGPGTFRDAVEDQILDTLVETRTPIELARQAGQGSVRDLRRRRARIAGRYYQRAQAPDQVVDPGALAQIDTLIEDAIRAQPQGSPASARLEALRQRISRGDRNNPGWTYETNAGTLDLAYREFRELLDLPVESPAKLSGTEINALRPAVIALEQLTGSNPNIARGRELHRAFSVRERMDPVRGPIAILAQGDGNAAERLETLAEGILYAGDVDPTEVATMVNRLARVDGGRDAIEGLFRGYVSSLADNATQIHARGAQATPSAVFAASLQGNGRRNLNAFFDALDQADQRAGLPRGGRRLAFENLMEVLDTTVGPAPAAQRNLTADDMVGVAGNHVRRFLSTFRPLMTPAAVLSQNVSERINQSRLKEGWDAIADAMTATGPEGVEAIRRMATAGRTGPAATRAAIELLAVRGPMLDIQEEEPEE